MMEDIPRQALSQLIAKYGRDVIADAKRCEGLIRDLCPAHRREANVLILALKERVPADLLASSASVPKSALLARLTKRLNDNLGLDQAFARWAVESWALALGRVSERDLAAGGNSAATRRTSKGGSRASPSANRPSSPLAVPAAGVAAGSCAACGGTHPGGGPRTIACSYSNAPSGRLGSTGVSQPLPKQSAAVAVPSAARCTSCGQVIQWKGMCPQCRSWKYWCGSINAAPVCHVSLVGTHSVGGLGGSAVCDHCRQAPSPSRAKRPTAAASAAGARAKATAPTSNVAPPKRSRAPEIAGLMAAVVTLLVLASLVRRNYGTARSGSPAVPPAAAPVATAPALPRQQPRGPANMAAPRGQDQPVPSAAEDRNRAASGQSAMAAPVVELVPLQDTAGRFTEICARVSESKQADQLAALEADLTWDHSCALAIFDSLGPYCRMHNDSNGAFRAKQGMKQGMAALSIRLADLTATSIREGLFCCRFVGRSGSSRPECQFSMAGLKGVDRAGRPIDGISASPSVLYAQLAPLPEATGQFDMPPSGSTGPQQR